MTNEMILKSHRGIKEEFKVQASLMDFNVIE